MNHQERADQMRIQSQRQGLDSIESIHMIDPTDGGEMTAPIIIKRSRPERDPRIFGSRYFKMGDGSAAIAIVAVYGGRAEYVCQACGAMAELDPIPTCFHDHASFDGSSDDFMEVEGDWAAYVGACANTEHQESAENAAVQCGIKLDEAHAYFLFAAEMETRSKLLYRR